MLCLSILLSVVFHLFTDDPGDLESMQCPDAIECPECECEILSDHNEIRRKRLSGMGVDFGEPGRRELELV